MGAPSILAKSWFTAGAPGAFACADGDRRADKKLL